MDHNGGAETGGENDVLQQCHRHKEGQKLSPIGVDTGQEFTHSSSSIGISNIPHFPENASRTISQTDGGSLSTH